MVGCVLGKRNWWALVESDLFGGCDAIVRAYDEITADFSEDERRALFSGNTEGLYGI